MIDLKAVEKSRKIFEEAKTFFSKKELNNCLIEISEKPMDQWEVWFANDPERIFKDSMLCCSFSIPFIAISMDIDKNQYFIFNNKILARNADMGSGEVILDEILEKRSFDIKEIQNEFFQLIKQVQGK